MWRSATTRSPEAATAEESQRPAPFTCRLLACELARILHATRSVCDRKDYSLVHFTLFKAEQTIEMFSVLNAGGSSNAGELAS